ncbi:MAG: 4-alpha-glucanotransferase [Oscillospiraceae bacterium]
MQRGAGRAVHAPKREEHFMRSSGLLLHIASLPNDSGIGTMGRETYAFVDYLEQCGQSVWQVLPLSPTSYGDSPYQSFSVFAGNPYLISLEFLERDGLLKSDVYKKTDLFTDPRRIDYGLLYETLFPILKLAFARFDLTDAAFCAYCADNSEWLREYGLFMALKDAHDGLPWNAWEKPLRERDTAAIAQAKLKFAAEIDFWCFLQYQFYAQWTALKRYANGKGIQIIGDIPIYCAYDSVDVWCEPALFQLDEALNPIVVAGFPPDAFSPDGQLWGNPIYDWEKMQADGFRWWIKRIAFAKSIYDTVRIDHFIGFNRYYAIPFGSPTARGGHWAEGPGYVLFQAVKAATGKGGIIAEDLGIITPAVRKLLRECGYPGMKVLQFGFSPDGDSAYLPQNYTSPNCVVYTGTHDNETVMGWVKSADKKTLGFCKSYLGVRKNAEIAWGFIDLAWKSIARISVTTVQDLCGYGNEARINTPSTLGGNWQWRALPSDFSDSNAQRLRELTALSNRLHGVKKTAIKTKKGATLRRRNEQE